MSLVSLAKCPSDPELPSRPPRPKFHHQYTNDRIREGSHRHPSFSMISKIRKDRKSVFREELELDTDSPLIFNEKVFGELTGLVPPQTPRRSEERHTGNESDDSRDDAASEHVEYRERQDDSKSLQSPASPSSSQKTWYAKLTPGRRPKIRSASSAPPPGMNVFTRLSTVALLIAVVIPAFSYYNGQGQVVLNGADAGVIRDTPKGPGPVLDTRAPSPTQWCKRWSQQTALLNGTLYIYGGQAKMTADQETDTWNNDFLTLDLTKSWDTRTPAFRGLAQPSGPPAVANGYLWNDYNNLYMYGGLFSDKPYVEPGPSSLWKYNIRDQRWTEFPSPKTLKGKHSDPGDVPVQRSAEGAGISVPELGLSWYFGGHLDLSTTPGWSNQIERVYLKSLLEFTHPGYVNDAVDALRTTGAGEGGGFRNITEGGLQSDAAFTERADGVLVFVPGWGDKGVLIGLGGGTADTFSESLSTLDVYDIANSEWFHQETRGTPPSVRVNACAVIVSAPDASSFNIYLYGGQNLQPYMGQTQYSDMYILSIPAFTWIKVESPGGPMPHPRAGHTCNLRDGQIVVLGGYVNTSTTPCESPGVFVFDASTLHWTNRFVARPHPADLHPDNAVLANSFGYQVPPLVASVIGGGPDGRATATTPAAGPATGGPFATGKPPVFTITASGATATITQWGPSATGGVGPGGNNPGGSGSGSNDPPAGLIAAGVIAGFASLLALYLGYCAWLYRRQVTAYRSHLAIANRYGPSTSRASGLAGFFGGARRHDDADDDNDDDSRHLVVPGAAAATQNMSEKQRRPASATSSIASAWRGALEPKYMFDDEPTPPAGSFGTSSVSPRGWGGSGASPFGSAASGSGMSRPTMEGSGSGTSGVPQVVVEEEDGVPKRSDSGKSAGSATLLEGQPSFFSVVMGPRRALRVVNGLEMENGGESR
ncbi:hypothetical protein QBC39DRAFT_407323 [Podospora conica]|nr:hypothetical protein QBC39DRAFT_407323 [Schizothecium conicum]